MFEELPEGPSAEASEHIETQIVAEDASASTQFEPQSASALSDQSASATASLTLDEFLRFVAGDIDQFWANTYSQAQWSYSSPLVVIAYEPVYIENAPGCGETFDPSNNGPGPVYCPENSTIYFPPDFLIPTTGLPLDQHGDFALAYVMAHEWGHHLQNLAGLTSEQYAFPTGKELQADCLAGVWANSTYYEGQLEPGDFEEAMTLAAVLGDDTLGVPAGQGTHGSAADRQVWFKYGYDSGDGSRCVVQ